MKINNKIKIIALSLAVLSFSSCLNDLDTSPKYETSLENLLQKDPNAVEGLVAKIYASLSMSSANGPGEADIAGPDQGETVFLRGIINLQDFTADAMKNRWGDNGLDQLTTTSNWTSDNKFFAYLYNRVYYTVPQSNNLIAALKVIDNPNKEQYIAELRFIRSFAYYYMIDCFGKGVLVTENDLGVTTPKPQASRKELFDYVEKELLEIEPIIAKNTAYGHANKATVQMLLAKLYLNAKVYTGNSRYDDAVVYLNKIINEGGYSLDSDFRKVVASDNNTSKEIIFPLIADPVGTESYGNTTYIINGGTGGTPPTVKASELGLTGDGWGGHRATKAWYGLFGSNKEDFSSSTSVDLVNSTDDRAKLFFTNAHNFEMNDYKNWNDGYPAIKYTNFTSSGTGNVTKFSGTDFPLFRLADAYLMYAECALRGASGATLSQALVYVNNVRTRSHASSIQASDLTLNFILAERARELNLEGHRRQDLIRFGKFTGSTYVWPWKGGEKEGKGIPSYYNLFPIPATALSANPNLTQNSGY